MEDFVEDNPFKPSDYIDKEEYGDLDLNFNKLYEYVVVCMRWSFCHPDQKRNFWWFLKFNYVNFTFVCMLYLLTYSIMYHDIPNSDIGEVFKNGFLLLIDISIMYKYYLVVYYGQKFKKLINVIEVDYANSYSIDPLERRVYLKYAQKSLRLCKYWLAMNMAICPLFILKSICIMIYLHYQGRFELVFILPMNLPQIIHRQNVAVVYVIKTIIDTSHIYFCCIIYLVFEPLVPLLVLHTCARLEICKNRLLNMYLNKASSDDTQNKFREIIITLQAVYEYIDEINSIVFMLYEITIKFNIISIPCVLIKLIEDYNNRDFKNVEFVSSFCGLFGLTFVPCYHSELLNQTAEEVRQSMYSCGWQNHYEIRHRTLIKLMMIRADRPPNIRKVFGIVCMETFTDMCRQAYAIFNLMNVAI